MFKIALLVSGSGSNMQSVIDNIESGFLNCEIHSVIASKEGIYSLERAEKHGIKSHVVSKKEYGNKTSDKILEILKDEVDLIVLAGYLSILDGEILREYKDRIINIHPSLIPSFCGPKMYGLKVHEAVVKAGVRYTGCTVHFVNEEVDAGAIIIQEAVPVYFEDDAEAVQKRVLEKEHIALPKAIKLLSENKIIVSDGKVKIIEG